MKKLSPPSDERNDLSPALTQNELPPQPVDSQLEVTDSKTLPPAKIYGRNLKRIKSYKKLRRNKKLSIQKQVFINDLQVILQEFNVDEHQLDYWSNS